MQLGQLARDAGAAGAEHARRVGQGLGQAVRRLEPDERLGALAQSLEEAAALALARRQEAQEDMGDGGQARDRQRGRRRRRARDDADGKTRGRGRLDQARARDPRASACPASETSATVSPAREPLEQLRRRATPRAARGTRRGARRGRSARRAWP